MNLHLSCMVILMLFTTTSIAETTKKIVHKHGIRSHTHVLPKVSGLSHQHNGIKPNSRPVVAKVIKPTTIVATGPNAHYHGPRNHTHLLPTTAYYHKHGNGQYGSLKKAAIAQTAVLQPKKEITKIPMSLRFKCSDISKAVAIIFLADGHNYLDRDNDGDPCEPHNFPEHKPYKAPTVSSSGSNCHYVSGYRRKSGSYVRGHTRCR